MHLLGQLFINGLFVGCVYALLGISFVVVFAPTKIWHFAHGAVYTVGAYAIYVLNAQLGLPLLLAVAGGAVVTALAGAACQAGLYRPLQRLGATPMVMVMASLGLMVVVENVLVLIFGPWTLSLATGAGAPLQVLGFTINRVQLVTLPVTALLLAVYLAFLQRTVLGQRLRALVSDEELLCINGVNTTRLKRLAFTLGSLILPVPCVLLALMSGVSPAMGTSVVLVAAMAVFVGGVDSFAGAALGGLLLGVVQNVGVWLIPTQWQTAIAYVVLLVFMMLRPTGIFGHALQKSGV